MVETLDTIDIEEEALANPRIEMNLIRLGVTLSPQTHYTAQEVLVLLSRFEKPIDETLRRQQQANDDVVLRYCMRQEPIVKVRTPGKWLFCSVCIASVAAFLVWMFWQVGVPY